MKLLRWPIVLLAALIFTAPGPNPGGWGLGGNPRVNNKPVPPLFSFASPTAYRGYPAYAGLPASDGCYPAASVTGTKGEALTFTRATTRFCPTSANEATGVMCASGEVCITSSGTTRGISIFRAGTNSLLRSEETDNAAWTTVSGGGPVAPTKDSTNSVVAPDGTTTAEVLTWPVVDGATRYSMLRQDVTVTAGHTGSLCVWVKKTGGAGSNLWLGNGSTTSNAATNCSPTSAWSRCCVPVVSVTGTVSADLGGNSYITAQGGSPMPSGISAAVWGWQLVTGASAATYATPYIKTEGVAATRNAEVANFNSITTANYPASLAATFTGSASAPAVAACATDGTRYLNLQVDSVHQLAGGAVGDKAANHSWTTGKRVAAASTGGNLVSYLDGVLANTTALVTPPAQATLTAMAIGTNCGTGFQPDGLVSNVCNDPDPTRCR